MIFKEKYISSKENSEKPDPKKTILSDDIYAVCEMLDKIIIKLSSLRLN